MWVRTFFIILFAILGICLLFSASNHNNSKHPDDGLCNEVKSISEPDFYNDSITIVKLMKYGREGDLKSLASLFSYPIDRKYPIPDIKDSVHFVRYASVIWDDSLKQVLRNTTYDDWKQFGWRGYSFRDGNYFWVDGGKVFSINYESSEEQKLWNELVKKEIVSLHSSLQKGVEYPYFSFQTKKEEWNGRVDCMKDGKYRLALYKGVCNSDDKPYFVVEEAEYEREGTMRNEHFVFIGDAVKVDLFISRYAASSMKIDRNGKKECHELSLIW